MHGDGRISNSFTARLGLGSVWDTGFWQPAAAATGSELAFMSNVHEIFRWLRLVGFLGAQEALNWSFRWLQRMRLRWKPLRIALESIWRNRL